MPDKNTKIKKTSDRKIVKLTLENVIPKEGKFLHTEKEFVRMVGFISNLKPFYQTFFYYEVPEDYNPKKRKKVQTKKNNS